MLCYKVHAGNGIILIEPSDIMFIITKLSGIRMGKQLYSAHCTFL